MGRNPVGFQRPVLALFAALVSLKVQPGSRAGACISPLSFVACLRGCMAADTWRLLVEHFDDHLLTDIAS